MPISHADRFIFVHIPKTAGTSVVETLLADGAELEFNERNVWPQLFGSRRGVELFRQLRAFYPLNTLCHFPQQHLPARILCEMVSDDVWSAYFKFTFVRNPWDVVVSQFHFLKEMFRADPTTAAGDPDVAWVVASLDFTNYVRALPYFGGGDLFGHISDAAGNVMVDFVGRIERIEEDFAAICRHVGIDLTLRRANASPHANYRDYYTNETREMVASAYARDIEVFGYTF